MAPIALYPTPQGSPGPVDLKEHLKPSVDQPQSSLFHHATPRPVAISAQGLYFTLDDGRTVLDGMSGGAAVACLGQGNTEVLGAMMEQASKMAYSYHLSVGCEAGEKLAAMICAKGDFEAAAFLNSGRQLNSMSAIADRLQGLRPSKRVSRWSDSIGLKKASCSASTSSLASQATTATPLVV